MRPFFTSGAKRPGLSPDYSLTKQRFICFLSLISFISSGGTGPHSALAICRMEGPWAEPGETPRSRLASVLASPCPHCLTKHCHLVTRARQCFPPSPPWEMFAPNVLKICSSGLTWDIPQDFRGGIFIQVWQHWRVLWIRNVHPINYKFYFVFFVGSYKRQLFFLLLWRKEAIKRTLLLGLKIVNNTLKVTIQWEVAFVGHWWKQFQRKKRV